MTNNKIKMLGKLGSLVGLSALAVAPIAIIGTSLDTSVTAEVNNVAVVKNDVGRTFLYADSQGIFECTILWEPSAGSFPGKVSIRGSSPLINDVVIPSAVVDENGAVFSVTEVEDYGFKGYSAMTSLVVPDSVISIGAHAFEDCTGLTNVVIFNHVETIGDYAFYNATDLDYLEIGSGIKSIGYKAFACFWEFAPDLTTLVVTAATPPKLGGDICFFSLFSEVFDMKQLSHDNHVLVPRKSIDAYNEGWTMSHSDYTAEAIEDYFV